jgi:hypothetical protein
MPTKSLYKGEPGYACRITCCDYWFWRVRRHGVSREAGKITGVMWSQENQMYILHTLRGTFSLVLSELKQRSAHELRTEVVEELISDLVNGYCQLGKVAEQCARIAV